MTEFLVELNRMVNAFVWGLPAMAAIIGVGLWLTCRTRVVQVVRFVPAMRATLGRIFDRRHAGVGAISPFHAVCTALAGTIGTGNIAGVAGAVAIGGPGAVFWMWCSALLGMATKFAEVTLAVRFRERGAGGEWVGGPMYTIKNGLGGKWVWLAYVYAVFGVLAVFGTGNATQVNTICSSIDSVAVNFLSVGPSGVSAINWTIGFAVAGFMSVYGNWVTVLTAVAICFFAFTTALGWGLYGSRCTEFVFGSRAVRPFLVLYALVSILGATVDLGAIWDVADTFNGLMAVPNLVALFLLSGKLIEIMKERGANEAHG